jgi:hypothetical protein
LLPVAPQWLAQFDKNGEAFADFAVPAQALLHADQVIRIATAWKRPSVGHGRARDN